jgi:hypothetical protein
MFKPMLMLAVPAALVAGQEPLQPPPPPGAQGGQEGHIMAQFYQLRVTRIQESLGLSEDRARALAERWGRWDREFIDRGRQMLQLRAQFSQILVGAGTEEEKGARLKPLVDQFLVLRQQQDEAKRSFEADILKSLTPPQQARMILLVEDIQTKIRETLREARRGGSRY